MSLRLSRHLTAFRVAVLYAAVGAVYIVASDNFLSILAGTYADYQLFQTFKGWAFIGTTAVALGLMLRGAWGRLERSLAEVSRAEDRLRGAIDAAGGCSWHTTTGPDGTMQILAAGRLAQRLGFSPARSRSLAELRAQVHPGDLAVFDAHMARQAEALSGSPAAIAPVLQRVRDIDGSYLWIRVVADAAPRSSAPDGGVFGVALDVSEQQETLQSLADVIAGGELGTWRHDLRTDRLIVNARWAEMIGYRLDDLPQMTINDWRAFVHPDDLAAMNRTQAVQFARRDYFFSEEFRLRHRDGHWVWVLSRGRAVEIAESGEALVLSGVHIDISHRKALESELLAKSEFLQRLTETSVSGIVALDADGVIVFANMEAQQILDAHGSGIIGRHHAELGWRMKTTEAEGGTAFPFARVAVTGKSLRDIRLTLPRPDGGTRVISVNAAPMQSHGGPVEVVCSVSEITQQLADERHLAQAAEEAQYAALHDALTGLPNRESFRAQVAPAIRRTKAEGGLLVQVFVSVDQFQQVKDRFGPQQGDRVIARLAERLEALRSADQVLARVGAQDFTFMHRCNIADAPEAVTRLLAAAFAEPIDLDGQMIYLSASMGVSVFPMDALNADEMWLNADLAMYEAKALGGNRAVTFTPRLRDRLAREAMIGQSLQRAIRDGAFALFLQPKVSLRPPFAVIGAEALVRCTDPGLEGIGPVDFMPVAEKTGLVRDIDLLVIDLVGRFVSGLRAEGKALRTSVNLSPESLRRAGFGQTVLDRLDAAGLGPADVLFEITEGVVVDLNSEARTNLEALLVSGYELSADDFGTGYSSLSYLQKLHLRELKIDRSFVSQLDIDGGASEAIVRATLAMAAALGLRTVAEGIDTEAQMAWLQAQGCDIGQGYLFGRPQRCAEFAASFLDLPTEDPAPRAQPIARPR